MFIDIEKFATEPDLSIAIFIGKTTFGNTHSGILTKVGNEIKFYHLAWHLSLECETLVELISNNNFTVKQWVQFAFFSKDPKVAKYRLPSIIKLLEMIFEKNRNRISYGLNFRDTFFSEDLDLVLGENENGLTCATFIACFFNKVGISLIDLATWIPRAEDIIWKKWIIELMEKTGVSRGQIENVLKEELNYRIKPEEIAVSSTKLPLPADYLYCSSIASSF